jgi:hypothetical protein
MFALVVLTGTVEGPDGRSTIRALLLKSEDTLVFGFVTTVGVSADVVAGSPE